MARLTMMSCKAMAFDLSEIEEIWTKELGHHEDHLDGLLRRVTNLDLDAAEVR